MKERKNIMKVRRILKKEKPAEIRIKDNQNRSSFFEKEWQQEEKKMLRWK